MPTADDLLDVLHAHADEAAQRADALRERLTVAPPRRNTRRVARLLAAAAVVVAAVTGAVVADVLHPGDGPVTSGGGRVALPDGSPHWLFRVDPVPGYAITRENARWGTNPADPAQGGWSQTATMRATPTGRPIAVIGVNPQWDPAVVRPARAESVTVAGQPGFFVPGGQVSRDYPSRSHAQRHPWGQASAWVQLQPTLYWRNPDGSWAHIAATFGFNPATFDYDNATALARLTRLAGHVHPVAADPVTMPFATHPLPAGYVAIQILNNSGGSCVGYTTPAVAARHPNPILLDTAVYVCRGPSAVIRKSLTAREYPGGPLLDLRNYSRPVGDGTALAADVPRALIDDPLPSSELRHLVDTADVTPTMDQPDTWLPIQR